MAARIHRLTERWYWSLDNLFVRKVPRDNNRDNVQAIRNEATIYALLSNDAHIVNCLSAGQTVNYVDLEYYPRGDLKAYFERKKGTITSAFRMRIARQVIEAVVVIHRKRIVHSDLALRQFLLGANDNARLSDFAASGYPGQWALGMECASHYLLRDSDLPNTVESDLLGVGSVLYEY
jgi:serine/threonine protein kinase